MYTLERTPAIGTMTTVVLALSIALATAWMIVQLAYG
jgi:hypothetical protein